MHSRGFRALYLVVNLRDLNRVRIRAFTIDHSERSRAIRGVSDVINVVWRVQVLAIPAAVPHVASVMYSQSTIIHVQKVTYMGKMTLDRIPPGHGVVGKLSVSRCGSKHGE